MPEVADYLDQERIDMILLEVEDYIYAANGPDMMGVLDMLD